MERKMRTPLIAGNWKMNTTLPEAQALINQMLPALERIEGVEKVLCPPFISLGVISGLLRESTVELAAQNMYWEDKGAFTGEISPLMLAGICQYVVLGHSERRQIFGESDELIARKVNSALRVHLKPILCVGERLVENETGQTEKVINHQLKLSLSGVGEPDGLVVAYEPVWAIGTGRAASSKEAGQTIHFIRQTLRGLFGESFAAQVRLLYGGSVTSANITDLLRQPEIDGALVGGASLKALEFISIVDQAGASKNLP
jgi:triosephosphate isomerase (TIM)